MTNGFTASAFLPRGIRRGSLFLLSFAFSLLFLTASSASAQNTTVLTVTTTGDTAGSCTGSANTSTDCTTLPAAITRADTDNPGDTIEFASTAYGTITITTTQALQLTTSMTIDGPGASLLTISGDNAHRIFFVNNDSVSISGLTLADAAPTAGEVGGAIHQPGGALVITDCTFTGNSDDNGGAIGSGGTLIVTNSTFSENQATGLTGGGAIDSQGGTLTVTGSTFSGNLAALSGGAIFLGNTLLGIDNDTVTVTNSTFSENRANEGYGGGAIDNAGSGTVTESYNLFYDNQPDAGVTLGPHDVSSDPSLAPLNNYGGPTETMMPEPGSAAICAGESSALTNALSNLGLPLTDQRGFPVAPAGGVGDGACANSNKIDIGAVQTNYLLVSNTSSDSGTVGSLPYEVSLANGQSYSDIGFDPTLGSATITLSSRLSLSSGDNVIIGPPDEVTISSTGPAEILEVSGSTTTVTLYGVTLAGGSVGPGVAAP